MIVFQVQLTYGAMGSPQHCSFSELNHRVSGTELKPGEEHVGLRKEGARISGRRGSGLGTGILKGEEWGWRLNQLPMANNLTNHAYLMSPP